MIYETQRLLTELSYQHWISQELFSPGWFITVGVLAIVYIIWFKIVDKSKLTSLLLLGSLCAVGFGLSDLILEGFYGLWEYRITLFPLKPPMFVVSYTICPLMFMIVAQYTNSWKSYLIGSSIGSAILNFGLLPLYVNLGIIKVHNFSYFWGFILFLIGGATARVIVLWLQKIELKHSTSTYPGSQMLQPAAAKKLHNSQEDEGTNN